MAFKEPSHWVDELVEKVLGVGIGPKPAWVDELIDELRAFDPDTPYSFKEFKPTVTEIGRQLSSLPTNTGTTAEEALYSVLIAVREFGYFSDPTPTK